MLARCHSLLLFNLDRIVERSWVNWEAENIVDVWPPLVRGGFQLGTTPASCLAAAATNVQREATPTLSLDRFTAVVMGVFPRRCVQVFIRAHVAMCAAESRCMCISQTFIINIMLAGKVHGSLARAGKVRGQAPKVAKQDKKKLPRGRAKKRLQYNRRFVNVGKPPPAVCCAARQLALLACCSLRSAQ